tara:strand:+ start:1877 stop:2056 length:180 start_codon:yes stop_codon:yes gene_type:complete
MASKKMVHPKTIKSNLANMGDEWQTHFGFESAYGIQDLFNAGMYWSMCPKILGLRHQGM